jgi:hypothetical protein
MSSFEQFWGRVSILEIGGNLELLKCESVRTDPIQWLGMVVGAHGGKKLSDGFLFLGMVRDWNEGVRTGPIHGVGKESSDKTPGPF